MPLLPFIEQNPVTSVYCFNEDWAHPSNAAAIQIAFALLRCPSNGMGDTITETGVAWIGNGNAAFAPPNAAGSGTNVLGGAVYPKGGSRDCLGWTGDYAAIGQVKTVKNASGAEIGFANGLVTVPWAGSGSKGATKQNGLTKITEITDGTSNTVLYSEAAGRAMQCYPGGSCVALPSNAITGPIWADSDNRITVTGIAPDGKTSNGQGPCVMNCNNQNGDIYSFHTGGANVAFADGSVRFLTSSIDINTLVSLVTKGGGEVVQVP